MSRRNATTTSTRKLPYPALVTLLVGAAVALTGAPASATDIELRTSVSRHYVSGGRNHTAEVLETGESYAGLITDGVRSRAATRGGLAGSGNGLAQKSGGLDFWFYEADVILFNDDDADGYYRGIDLLFDIDTIYASAEVYGVLYLSFEGGPWNEYGQTEDFTVNGTAANDEYVMVTDLMSGYPTGSYDLLIELFDAYDGTFLADFGPEDTSELAYLPLEDYNRDAAIETQIVVNSGSGGGGSLDALMLAALLLILIGGAAVKIWRRRNDTLMRIDSPAPCWRSQQVNGEPFNR